MKKTDKTNVLSVNFRDAVSITVHRREMLNRRNVKTLILSEQIIGVG